MMDFGPIDFKTFYFYLGIIFVVFFLSKLKIYKLKRRTMLYLPMVILWFFAATRDFVGADYQNYYDIFNFSGFGRYAYDDTTIEKGFYYLNVVLHMICSYRYFGFFFFHFVILYLTYRTIIYFKGEISYSFAILAYMCLWYFLSFSLLRICIAAAIVGFAMRYIFEKEYKKYFIAIFIASLLHMSSMVMVVPAVLYIFYLKHAKVTMISFICGFIVIYGGITVLTQFITIERYAMYLDADMGTTMGAKIIFTYAPVFYWLYLGKGKVGKSYWQVCLIFILFACMVDFSSYRIEILGRLRTYAVVPFIIYLPLLVKALYKKHKIKYNLQIVAIFIYFIFSYLIMTPQLFWSDEIMPYKSLVFNF